MGLPNLVENVNGAGSSPQSCPFSISCAVGELLVVGVGTQFINSTTPTVSGTLNGNLSVIASNYDPVSDVYEYIYSKVVTISGVETITTTNVGSYFNYCTASHWNGFTGTPTWDTSYSVASGSVNPVATSPSTNHNNEVLITSFYNGSYITSGTPSGWTSLNGWFNWFNAQATAGTSCAFSATLNASQPWSLLLAGFYDAPASVGIPMGWIHR